MQADGQYMVEYEAFHTLVLDGMEWYASLYTLCGDPTLRLDEITIAKQHIKPLRFPEVAIWKKKERRGGPGRGRGRGRGGRGGRRGVGRGGRIGDPALDDGGVAGDDARPDDGEAGSGSGTAPSADGASESDAMDCDSDSVAAESIGSDDLFGGPLEALNVNHK